MDFGEKVVSPRIDRYRLRMSTINEIEEAVSGLSPEDLSRFREWFFEFDARVWDRKLEADVAAGRLESLAAEALEEHRGGIGERDDLV